MKDRTYTDREVAALLERTAELQVEAARRARGGPGITLGELETIAAEAGLDPALLRQAADELDAPGRSLLDTGVGATATHLFVERRVPGALTPEAWEEIVAELRHRFNTDMGASMGMPGYGTGTTEQIGHTMEWRHTSLSGIETRVMIRPHGDDLRIRLSQRVGLAGPATEATLYGAVVTLLVFGIGMAAKLEGLGLAALVLTALLSIPLIFYLDKAWRRKKRRELEALADRLAGLAGTAQPAAASTAVRTPREASPPVRPLLENVSPEPEPFRPANRTRASS